MQLSESPSASRSCFLSQSCSVISGTPQLGDLVETLLRASLSNILLAWKAKRKEWGQRQEVGQPRHTFAVCTTQQTS